MQFALCKFPINKQLVSYKVELFVNVEFISENPRLLLLLKVITACNFLINLIIQFNMALVYMFAEFISWPFAYYVDYRFLM